LDERVNGRLPISLVVITRNEERNLERCLRAADFCEEMIVVDSGSTDRTLEIARKFGAHILHRNWTGYGDQKNFGSQQASRPWVLCIDADEVVTSELRDSLAAVFRTNPAVDAFEINRHAFYAGRRIDHSGWYPQWRLFLYRKGAAQWSGEEPHPVAVFLGKKKERLGGDLNHYTYENIRQHISKNLASAEAAAIAMHECGRKATAFDLWCRGPWAFVRTYILQLGFLDGFYGLVIAVMAGCYSFSKYAMLRELNRRRERRDTIP
jgi:hypothetical protein